MKHTPGPWTFDENSFDKTITANNDIYHGVIVFDEGCFESEEGIANARLIATAPEMRNELIDSYKRSGLHQNIIERATGLNIEEVLEIYEKHN